MALVLLPCDLPTWPTLQRHLNAMKREVRTGGQLKDALLKIYNLCNTSLEPDEETLGDQKVFDVLCDEVVDTWLSDDERQDLFDTQLPTMVDYALQLKSLKPLRGLHFSLQQQSDRVEIERRFAASLVAHAFFSTFPRRTVKTHPTLQDFNFAGHFFQHLLRRSQRAKLRSVLHYFQRLNERPPEGHVTFARQVMSGREWCTLEEWLQCRRPLCPLVVRHDGRVEYPSSSDLSSPSSSATNNRPTVGQSTEPPAGIRVCFASRRIGGTFLDDGTSQECAAFSSHPELLSLLPYVESLEDNEAITASGLCTYSIIHDLKNKAVFETAAAAAAAGQQTATTKATTTTPIQQVTLTQTPMCLIDAEDYSDLPIRQYEEDNVLRELNKAYLGFRQHYPDAATTTTTTAAGSELIQQPQEQLQQRLPPVGASRDSSPSSRQASTIIDHAISQDWADLTRSTTLVASSGDPSSPRPSLCPSMPSQDLQSHLPGGDETDRGRPAANPTLLYGGGRNAPLTLAKATVVKQIMTQQQQQQQQHASKKTDAPPDLSKLPSSVVPRKAGSVYASCHSQDDELNSSTEEFRSANTSLDEDEIRPAVINRLQQRHSAGNSIEDGRQDKSRSQSTESDSSPEDRRPESRGFALDSHNEEDSFSGDGLEREKRWLDHFRERRGPRSSRSGGPKDSSSSSSKDSSRYSFSTEFSSELDELYDQFSHWLEDPNGGGESGQPNGRNAAVFRFAHGLLKRALSDSFASVALNIENLSANPETRMKDIKLSSSSEMRRGSTQRSWSLNEHVGDERLALQLAREMVEREIPMEEQVLPMPDIVPLLPVDAIEEETLDQDQPPEPSPANKKKSNNNSLGSKSKVACQLVSIVLEQRLAEVELELQVPGSSRISSAHHHAARPSLISTRCPGGHCPAPLRTQESVAWEYHQNPSCSFNIRLDRAARPAAKCRLAAILGHSATPQGQTAGATTTPTPLTTTTTTTTTPCTPSSTTSTNPSPLGSAAKSSQHSVERVVLLDRMSPVESEEEASGTELLLQGVGRCCEAISESQSNRSSKADEDSESQTPTPMNPTPPRTRRGSWFFKKSREQRHHNPGIKHQRARSNSVPTVMELSQLSLWQQQMAEQLKQSLIPDIIVSGENTEEDDECFTPGSSREPQQSRRHRSYDDQLQNFAQSSESLLSDDVVEGFSWTMAETIIEDILKEIGSKQTQLSLPSRHNPSGGGGGGGGGVGKSGGPLKMANKLPGKSILKISSNDSLHRSHSGSLEQPQQESVVERPTFAVHKTIAEHMAEQQNAPMSWSHRSTSMPSLRAIDELESLNTSSIIDEGDAAQLTNGNPRDDEKPFRHVNGGLLPIITGNWGCGSSGGGDAQLKSMLQWLAASRSGAPSLVYYTAGASSVVKLDIVCRVIMDRQWTVGDLAGALLRYCRARLDPRRLDLSLISRLETHYQAVIAGSSGVDAAHQRHISSLSTASECPGANPGTDRLLFDELLGQYPLKQTEL